MEDIATAHYEQLRVFLSGQLVQSSGKKHSQQRQSAKDKLSKLSSAQFLELSTDVYDELLRRVTDICNPPFLPLDVNFHPKRNQARQKLATLPLNRFKDLAIDVYWEIERRVPAAVEAFVKKHGNDAVPPLSAGPVDSTQKFPSSTTPNLPSASIASPDLDNKGFSPAAYDYETDASLSNLISSSSSNATPSSSAKPLPQSDTQQTASDTVNFSSLDNLMADLGSMLTPQQSKSPQPTTQANGDQKTLSQIKTEYETEIKSLQQRITELTTTKTASTTEKLTLLESKLNSQIAKNKELESKIEDLETQVSRIRGEKSELEDLYSTQVKITNEIRTEATSLMVEIKSLTEKIQVLERDVVEREERIKLLIEDNQRLEMQELNISSPLTSNHANSTSGGANIGGGANGSSGVGEPTGVIARSRVTAYQSAVEDLLRAARSEYPTSVLVATKSIVIACKNITEDTERYETTVTNDHTLLQQLTQIKEKLSNALTVLMTAAKSHATSLGVGETVQNVDSAATGLTSVVVELVKVLGIKPEVDTTTQQQMLARSVSQQKQQGRKKSVTGDSGAMEIDALKQYLEKQTDRIVQAIQSVLLAMRSMQPVSEQQEEEFMRNVEMIITVVEEVVGTSTESIESVGRGGGSEVLMGEGMEVLKKLENANLGLKSLGMSLQKNGQSKTVKQRLASCSYDIAKVKNLVVFFLGGCGWCFD
ncbi:component of the polarisome [Nowakowskiella sp. JEL0407]|nr:component of the polarisome [Nowakowskiella sp. JEL0407]